MKRIFLIALVSALTLTVMAMPVFSSHGGGRHGNSRRTQTTYNSSATAYRAPYTYKSGSGAGAASVSTVAAVCGVKDCLVIGEHSHNGGSTVTHYYGDGHDYHGEYDHYYGDGHDYHDRYGHAYHAGELHH